jgi:hypothetical protein
VRGSGGTSALSAPRQHRSAFVVAASFVDHDRSDFVIADHPSSIGVPITRLAASSVLRSARLHRRLWVGTP